VSKIEEKVYQVYLAGPCFSAAERMWNHIVKEKLESYCDGMRMVFYLPQERIEAGWPSYEIRKELVTGLENSQAIVANLDGPGGDDGTCWEMGFVAGVNSVLSMIGHNPLKDIFWYRTDFRSGGDSKFNVNLMMAHGGAEIIIPDTKPTMAAKYIADALQRKREVIRSSFSIPR
jgi:hypothetical protein